MILHEMAVGQEMLTVMEAEDQTVHHAVIMVHQEAKIILQIEVQIEIQNMEILKMPMVPQTGR